MKINVIKHHFKYELGENDVDEATANYLIRAGIAEEITKEKPHRERTKEKKVVKRKKEKVEHKGVPTSTKKHIT